MKICQIENCDKPVKAKDMCSMHHQRWRRHGDPIVTKVRKPAHPTTCQWVKCERRTLSKGYCSKHYYIKRMLGSQVL